MEYGIKGFRKFIGTAVRKALGSVILTVTQEPVVVLTFDDGPDSEFISRLLELLEGHQAQGTFFMVGESAQMYPDLVRRVAKGGHAIGSHSWNHCPFPLLGSRERRAQLRACEQALAPYGQRLFRPPYGQQTLASRLDALLLGYEVVCWSLDVGDWYESDGAVMADHLVKCMVPGGVVLFHDSLFDRGKPFHGLELYRKPWCDREAMLAALEMMFERVGDRFRFVTVPELLRYGSPYREFWFKPSQPP